MSFDNALPPGPAQLTCLEETRTRLLETMFSLRCACAEVFADPLRNEDERDGAAWELARAVGAIRRCDEELHALREADRESRRGSAHRLIGSGSFR